MRRAFEADVLAGSRCGGRMVLLATIEDPAVITRILTRSGSGRPRGRRTRRWMTKPPPATFTTRRTNRAVALNATT
jgi:hypothetical protein